MDLRADVQSRSTPSPLDEHDWQHIEMGRGLAIYLSDIECLESLIEIRNDTEDFIELRIAREIWYLIKDDLKWGEARGATFSICNGRLEYSDKMFDFISYTYRTYQLEDHSRSLEWMERSNNTLPSVPGDPAPREDAESIKLRYSLALGTNGDYDGQSTLGTNEGYERGKITLFVSSNLGEIFEEGRCLPIISVNSIPEKEIFRLVMAQRIWNLLRLDLLEARRRGVIYYCGTYNDQPCLDATGGLCMFMEEKYELYKNNENA
jgi:hypothetical protein